MNEDLYKIANVIVGNYDLANVWTGLVACAFSSIITLRIILGYRFLYKVRLIDVIVWFIGIYLIIRFSFFFLEIMPFLKTNEAIDSILIGLASGIVTVLILNKKQL